LTPEPPERAAETALFELGFREYRVRLVNEHTAKIQVTATDEALCGNAAGYWPDCLPLRDILLDLDERKGIDMNRDRILDLLKAVRN
jgi:hypothetical protein